ncbi:MAG: hypothetical protein V4474_00955 [Patescibacteria group bacterium]
MSAQVIRRRVDQWKGPPPPRRPTPADISWVPQQPLVQDRGPSLVSALMPLPITAVTIAALFLAAFVAVVIG